MRGLHHQLGGGIVGQTVTLGRCAPRAPLEILWHDLVTAAWPPASRRAALRQPTTRSLTVAPDEFEQLGLVGLVQRPEAHQCGVDK
jgi:hypothetical protein